MRLALLLLPLLLSADAAFDTRIQSLENELKHLKDAHEKTLLQLEEITPILEEVERKSLMDRINLNPELQLRFDKLHYEVGRFESPQTMYHDSEGNPTTPRRDDFKKDFDIASSVMFKLAMNADLLKKLSFHGRMLVHRTSQSSQRLCILSSDIKSARSRTAIDVDRAYVDYRFNALEQLPMIFSMGILPTSGGTPMQYAQKSKRKSVYPALVFDMNTYGLGMTADLRNYTGMRSFLRLILAKAYTLDPDLYAYQCNRSNIDNANITGLYADAYVGESLLISAGINRIGHLKARPYLGPDIPTDNADELGTMYTVGIGLDATGLLKNTLTMFAHAALSAPNANDNIDDYQIKNDENDENAFTLDSYATGSMLSQSGYAFYAGLKYDINTAFSFGAEYNHGSKYWFAATQGAEDMYNKLSVRGHVGETYLLWQFYPGLYSKLGYMYTRETYTGSGWHFAEPIRKEGTQNVTYLTFNAKF